MTKSPIEIIRKITIEDAEAVIKELLALTAEEARNRIKAKPILWWHIAKYFTQHEKNDLHKQRKETHQKKREEEKYTDNKQKMVKDMVESMWKASDEWLPSQMFKLRKLWEGLINIWIPYADGNTMKFKGVITVKRKDNPYWFEMVKNEMPRYDKY